MLLAFKQRHYADWLDQSLPALDGDTPRQAARTAAGRAAVDLLLKDMENLEQRLSPGAAFDFTPLRRELRLGGRRFAYTPRGPTHEVLGYLERLLQLVMIY